MTAGGRTAAPATLADRRLVAAAALLWGLVAALLAWRLRGLAVDDFFITYRYAWNLAAGHGFVFNPGERVFGLTEPGLGLLLAALTVLTRVTLPTLGTITMAVALVGLALVLLAEGCARGRRMESLVAGTLIVSSSYLWLNQGAGIPLALLLLALAARLAPERPWLAGLAAGCAVWLRPDAAAGAGLLALLLWGERRRFPWRYAALVVALAAAAAAAWLYFGAPLPNTLAAKHAMAAAEDAGGGPERFWSHAAPILARHWGAGWLLVAAAGIAGQWPLYQAMGRAGRLLVLFSAFSAIAYPRLGLPFFSWYTVPSAVAALYGLVFLAGAIGRSAAAALGEGRRRFGGWVGAAVAAGLLAVPLASLAPASWSWLRGFDWQPHLKSYGQAALWLHRHTAPTDEVAYVEIGVLAYYSRRPVVDLLGLVTPGSIPFVEQGDLPGAFLAHPTPYVIYHTRGRMGPLLDRRWFWRAYEEVARFTQSNGAWLAIYRRVPGSSLPPPRAPQPPRR